jgi:competence protein ComEC
VTERVRVTAPHVVVAALCMGLSLALVVDARSAVVVAIAAVFALVALVVDRRRTALLALSLALLGSWWASVRLERLNASALFDEIGRAAPARVEVTGPARRSDFALRVPVDVVRFGERAVDESARLELPPERAPPQGAILDLVASVRRPRAPDSAGAFDEATYLRREGVRVVLQADRFEVVGRRAGIGGVADALRRRLATSISPGVAGERRAVVAGVVLGEDEGLTRDLRDDFRAAGLYHLLAVSGQNVAYVVGGALLLAWALGLPRWAGHVVALVAVASYVLAVGWQPSVVRAGVAGTLASLAWIASRPADRWYFLLCGAALLLAVNPYSLLAPGFQLSFAAVAAIFVAVPRLERWLEGFPVPRRLVAAVAVSIGCGLATAPILWLHFGAIPLFAVAANALAAPVVAPLLGLALAAAALAPVLPSAAAAVAWTNGWLAAYLAWCARLVGDLPYAEATAPEELALVAVAALVVAIAVRLRPPRGPRLVGLVSMVGALAVGWWLWGIGDRAPPPPDGLRITFLDVGQGDAILVQVPQGAVLVDQGPPEADVAEQLDELDVERLAALVLTHPQRDHVGGAADVLREHRVDVALDPGLRSESPDQRDALAAADRRDVAVVVARAGRVFRLGRLRLEVLWPDEGGGPGEDPNRRAIVLLASYGATDVLLTADAESDVTSPLRPPPVEVLKVAHHGSDDPRLDELLAIVRPRVAVISVGAHNDYGHPDPDTLTTLERVPGLSLFRTDHDGRIVLESDGRTLSVTTER